MQINHTKSMRFVYGKTLALLGVIFFVLLSAVAVSSNLKFSQYIGIQQARAVQTPGDDNGGAPPPKVTVSANSPEVYSDGSFVVGLSADGGLGEYVWGGNGSGGSVNGATGKYVTVHGNIPSGQASETFQVWAVDSRDYHNGSGAISITATRPAPSVVPVQVSALSQPSGNIQRGGNLSGSYRATGGSGAGYDWNMTGPSWLSIDQNGLLSGTVPTSSASQPAGSVSVSVTVRDRSNSSNQASTGFTVTVVNSTITVSLSGAPSGDFHPGHTVTISFTASGLPSGNYLWGMNGPSWMSINNGTVTANIPSSQPAGQVSFAVWAVDASDSTNGSGAVQSSITVVAPVSTPDTYTATPSVVDVNLEPNKIQSGQISVMRNGQSFNSPFNASVSLGGNWLTASAGLYGAVTYNINSAGLTPSGLAPYMGRITLSGDGWQTSLDVAVRLTVTAPAANNNITTSPSTPSYTLETNKTQTGNILSVLNNGAAARPSAATADASWIKNVSINSLYGYVYYTIDTNGLAAGPYSGHITITGDGWITTVIVSLTVTAPATSNVITVTGLTPTSGPPGTAITINGTNLSHINSIILAGPGAVYGPSVANGQFTLPAVIQEGVYSFGVATFDSGYTIFNSSTITFTVTSQQAITYAATISPNPVAVGGQYTVNITKTIVGQTQPAPSLAVQIQGGKRGGGKFIPFHSATTNAGGSITETMLGDASYAGDWDLGVTIGNATYAVPFTVTAPGGLEAPTFTVSPGDAAHPIPKGKDTLVTLSGTHLSRATGIVGIARVSAFAVVNDSTATFHINPTTDFPDTLSGGLSWADSSGDSHNAALTLNFGTSDSTTYAVTIAPTSVAVGGQYTVSITKTIGGQTQPAGGLAVQIQGGKRGGGKFIPLHPATTNAGGSVTETMPGDASYAGDWDLGVTVGNTTYAVPFTVTAPAAGDMVVTSSDTPSMARGTPGHPNTKTITLTGRNLKDAKVFINQLGLTAVIKNTTDTSIVLEMTVTSDAHVTSPDSWNITLYRPGSSATTTFRLEITDPAASTVIYRVFIPAGELDPPIPLGGNFNFHVSKTQNGQTTVAAGIGVSARMFAANGATVFSSGTTGADGVYKYTVPVRPEYAGLWRAWVTPNGGTESDAFYLTVYNPNGGGCVVNCGGGPAGAVISGKVTNKNTGQPLLGVVIYENSHLNMVSGYQVVPAGQGTLKVGTTNSAGEIVFDEEFIYYLQTKFPSGTIAITNAFRTLTLPTGTTAIPGGLTLRYEYQTLKETYTPTFRTVGTTTTLDFSYAMNVGGTTGAPTVSAVTPAKWERGKTTHVVVMGTNLGKIGRIVGSSQVTASNLIASAGKVEFDAAVIANAFLSASYPITLVEILDAQGTAGQFVSFNVEIIDSVQTPPFAGISKVTDKNTGAPLAGVAVYDNTRIKTTTTNPNGPDFGTGTYFVATLEPNEIWKDGHDFTYKITGANFRAPMSVYFYSSDDRGAALYINVASIVDSSTAYVVVSGSDMSKLATSDSVGYYAIRGNDIAENMGFLDVRSGGQPPFTPPPSSGGGNPTGPTTTITYPSVPAGQGTLKVGVTNAAGEIVYDQDFIDYLKSVFGANAVAVSNANRTITLPAGTTSIPGGLTLRYEYQNLKETDTPTVQNSVLNVSHSMNLGAIVTTAGTIVSGKVTGNTTGQSLAGAQIYENNIVKTTGTGGPAIPTPTGPPDGAMYLLHNQPGGGKIGLAFLGKNFSPDMKVFLWHTDTNDDNTVVDYFPVTVISGTTAVAMVPEVLFSDGYLQGYLISNYGSSDYVAFGQAHMPNEINGPDPVPGVAAQGTTYETRSGQGTLKVGTTNSAGEIVFSQDFVDYLQTKFPSGTIAATNGFRTLTLPKGTTAIPGGLVTRYEYQSFKETKTIIFSTANNQTIFDLSQAMNLGTAILGAPAITSFSPVAGLPGDRITITGANFSSTGNKIWLDGFSYGPVASYENGSKIDFIVPASGAGLISAGAHKLKVENAQGVQSQVAVTLFTITQRAASTSPTISSINPAKFERGKTTHVLVTGTNLGKIGMVIVSYAGTVASSSIKPSANQVEFDFAVKADAFLSAVWPISLIEILDAQGNTGQFVSVNIEIADGTQPPILPTISSVVPGQAAIGQTTHITISGQNLGGTTSVRVQQSGGQSFSFVTQIGFLNLSASAGKVEFDMTVAQGAPAVLVPLELMSQNLPTAQFSIQIAASGPSSVTIRSPNGGEQLAYNQPSNITWTSSGNDLYGIWLGLYQNDRFFKWIAKDLNNTGSFSWTPSQNLSPSEVGSGFKILVSASKPGSNNYIEDFSDAPFSITALAAGSVSLTVVSPDSTVSVHPGGTITVRWSRTGTFADSDPNRLYYVYLKNSPVQILGQTNQGPTGITYLAVRFRSQTLEYPSFTISTSTLIAPGQWYVEIDYADLNGIPVASGTNSTPFSIIP